MELAGAEHVHPGGRADSGRYHHVDIGELGDYPGFGEDGGDHGAAAGFLGEHWRAAKGFCRSYEWMGEVAILPWLLHGSGSVVPLCFPV